MLRHIITWRLAAEDTATKLADGARISSELQRLPSEIPDIKSLTVGTNAVDIEGNSDLVLIVDFDDEEGLRRYGPHPAHQRFVEFVLPLVSERAAIDFLI